MSKKSFEIVCTDSMTVRIRTLLNSVFQCRELCSPRLRAFLNELDSIKLGDDTHEYLTLTIDKWSFKKCP